MDILLSLFFLKSLPADSAEPECRSRGEGKLIGRLITRQHGVQGTVHAVDKYHLFIMNFIYDGGGPDTVFWVGNDPVPSRNGILVPYPGNFDKKLMKYHGAAILLKLPGDRTLKDIKWLAVWDRKFKMNFGEVMLPKGLKPPYPRVIPGFSHLAHSVQSGNITIEDGKTFFISKFYYDGKGPKTWFIVGSGMQPSEVGTKVPDEFGSLHVLRRYNGEHVRIQLPGHLTACDIDWLAVFSIKFQRNFGHVFVPKDLDVPPAIGQQPINASPSSLLGRHLLLTLSAGLSSHQLPSY